jgi:hypothetical protein
MLIVWPIVRYDRSREQDCPSNTDYLNPNQPAHTGRGVAVSADFVKIFTAIFKSLWALFCRGGNESRGSAARVMAAGMSLRSVSQ